MRRILNAILWIFRSIESQCRSIEVLKLNFVCDTTKHIMLLGAILRKTCAILLQFVEQKRNLGFHTPKGGPHTLKKSKYCLAKVEHCVAKMKMCAILRNKVVILLHFVEDEYKIRVDTTRM